MTETEKREILNEAVECIKFAQVNMQKAEKLLKKIGIELCEGLYFSNSRSRDIHLYRGLPKIEKITETEAKFAKSWDGKIDKSVKELEYRGVKMIQCGDEVRTNFKFR